MAKWLVTYEAEYFVEADTEEEAVEFAIEEHEDLPDGIWEAKMYPEVTD